MYSPKFLEYIPERILLLYYKNVGSNKRFLVPFINFPKSLTRYFISCGRFFFPLKFG